MDYEYEKKYLRDEMVVDKKYIFEKAFIFASLSAFLSLFKSEYVFLIIGGITLIFNFFFIFDRVRSHARIAGYLKVYVEAYDKSPNNGYLGWENYLSIYRKYSTHIRSIKWKKGKSLAEKRKELKCNTFIKTIYLYHFLLEIVLVGIALNVYMQNKSMINICIFYGMISMVVIYLIIAIRVFIQIDISHLVQTEIMRAENIQDRLFSA